MGVQDVGIERANLAQHAPGRGEVGGGDLAAHRKALEAERQRRHQLVEEAFLILAAGRGVADDADRVAVAGLLAREVGDMAEESADR